MTVVPEAEERTFPEDGRKSETVKQRREESSDPEIGCLSRGGGKRGVLEAGALAVKKARGQSQ